MDEKKKKKKNFWATSSSSGMTWNKFPRGEMDFPHRGDKMVTLTMFPQGKKD
jgi:hypothetical protein